MNLPKLRAEEFPDFFTELNGKDRNGTPIEPFRWQSRLAAQVTSKGRWPPTLDLPTSAGKTAAALDVALFHLALEADKGPRRRAPLRLALVVDRRVIVNSAYKHARLIEERLQEALDFKDTRNVLHRVARRLMHLSDGEKPVVARALLGGVPREDDWARTPCQPTILCSTVDQVGSRLLFRGYGVSDSMKPVHAGLLGCDCLIFLDEAHLSEPFKQTLEAIERFRRPPWTEREPAPWAHVKLSATPGNARESTTFSLNRRERADRRLAPRLAAAKPAELVVAKARSNQPELHANELVDHAWRLSGAASDGEAHKIVALVVNRVALARRCHKEIRARIEKSGVSAESVLFIGRTREIDRQGLMKAYESKLESGHDDPEKTLFVVSTQCIEAGADFDFNILVTQAAPLDVLRQRFGRVNRLGRRVPVDAVILACRDEVDGRREDPLYGTRTKTTWDWLVAQSTRDRVDFGVNALDMSLEGEDVSLLTTESRDAPIVMPAYIDLWAQTSPMPTADPEPALFLHGAPNTADVQIVWRADIEQSDLDDETMSGRALRLLSLMPPKAAEAVAVPIYAARAWLAGKAAVPVNDVEGSTDTETDPRIGQRIPAVRWRGDDSDNTGTVKPWNLRPGDLVVVAGDEGGCDEYGWAPGSDERVTDVGEIAQRPYERHRFVFRVHRRLLEDALRAATGVPPTPQDVESVWRKIHFNMQEARNERGGANVAKWLLKADGLPREWCEILGGFEKAGNAQVVFPYDDDDARQVTGLVLIAPRGINRRTVERSRQPAIASTDCGDAGSFQANSVTLAVHAGHVADKARVYARCAGLPPRLVEAIVLAARLHDEGKRDSRFQLYLRRADRLESATDHRVLAKSNKGVMDRKTELRVRERAGLPSAWRHEADSVRRALQGERLAAAQDPRLVLWLVGTHHGYGRPLYPHTDPVNSGPQDLDFLIHGEDWSQMFAKLLRYYGAWELARFEAIVRLADHRASQEEQTQNPEANAKAKVA